MGIYHTDHPGPEANLSAQSLCKSQWGSFDSVWCSQAQNDSRSFDSGNQGMMRGMQMYIYYYLFISIHVHYKLYIPCN